MADRPILAARGIVKRFQDNVVLRGIDIDLIGGRMLGLVGANGAGKSTLVKILCGALRADAGVVQLDGIPRGFRSVTEALAAGIAVAHQQVSIIPCLTGAENIMLSREPVRGMFIDSRATLREAMILAERFGVTVDLRRSCANMSVGEQKIVDILKALAHHPRILILDEPTASLTLAESRRLFTFLRDLRRHGLATLLISHHLSEVAKECDEVAILKDGSKVYDGPASAITIADMARLMVGRTVEKMDWRSYVHIDEAAIQIKDLRLDHLLVPEITVRRGEVVGLAGLLGAGQTQLLERLAGFSYSTSVVAARVGALPRLPVSVSEGVANAIFLIPDNRVLKAMLTGLGVAENIAAGSLPLLSRWGFINTPSMATFAHAVIARLGISCAGPWQTVAKLSGGNQQKVAFGRWLARTGTGAQAGSAIFLLNNPTEGIDVGAKVEIYTLIRHFAEEGAAVLVSSTEFAELVTLCERVYCIRHNTVAACVSRSELSEDRLMIEVN